MRNTPKGCIPLNITNLQYIMALTHEGPICVSTTYKLLFFTQLPDSPLPGRDFGKESGCGRAEGSTLLCQGIK